MNLYQDLYNWLNSYYMVSRGGAIGKTRGSESDDRSPLVSGLNPVAATFAFAILRKLAFHRLQKS